MASDKKIRFPSSAARQAYYRNRKKILANEDICAICGGAVDKTLPAYHPLSAEVDHKIPVTKGGDPANIENLQLAHRKCNQTKFNKVPEIVQEKEGVDPKSWLNWA